MNINNTYEHDVELMIQLKIPENFYEVTETYQEDIEEIYNQEKDENVTIPTAKGCLGFQKI